MSMQKGKHQGGQNQGFSRYSPSAYPQRQPAPQRGGDVYLTTGYPPQAGGGPGGGPSGPGGPQMRVGMGMPMPQQTSHASQQQGGPGGPGPAPTSTPPGPGHGAADMSKGLHMQGQGQIQGGMMPFQVAGAPRQGATNYNYQPRAQAPRMPGRNQQALFQMGNGQQLVPGQQHSYMLQQNVNFLPVQMYAQNARLNSGGPQASFYPNQQHQYLIQAANMGSHHSVFYPLQTVRQSPGGVNISGTPQAQQTLQSATPHGPNQSPIIPVSGTMMQTVIPAAQTGGGVAPQTQQKRRRTNALPVLHPITGRDVIEDMENETSTSGGSSNRETPQPESLQNHNVAAEFAERVGKAASEDSTPSAPIQTPDLQQPMGSLNGPAQPEPISDPSLSQSNYIEDSSIGNSWNKAGHKGAVELGDKLHDVQSMYLYPSSPVIPSNSAKLYDLQDMYPSPVPIMVHHAGVMPSRTGVLPNSLLSDQTPVVSANTNAPSVPVEHYRFRGPQQPGGVSSGHPSHASPQRRKARQDNTAAVSSNSSATSVSSTESSSHVDGKKKGSPTPGSAPASGQPKAQSGAGQQKEGKREKARNATPKDVPREAAADKSPQTDKPEPAPAVAKGKSPSPSASAATSPSVASVQATAVTTSSSTATSNKIAPTVAAAPVPAVPAAATAPAPATSPSSTPAPAPEAFPSPTPAVAVTDAASTALTAAPSAAAETVAGASADAKEDKGTSAKANVEPSADQDGKSSNRNKGKKMRDSNAKSAEKEGSDIEASAEPALPEDGSSTTASTPTPSESASGSSPVPEVAQPVATPTPRPVSPKPGATAVGSAAAPDPAPVMPALSPDSAEPKESASTPEVETMPEPTVVAPAVAPSAAISNPPPASVSSASTGAVNLFNPPFALPSPPILMPKITSNKEKESNEKEDKLVAARNQENTKVSGLKEDNSDKRMYRPDQWSPHNPEGKKKYDRNFLMELRSDPQSQKKPDGLPDMEVVLKDGINKKIQQHNFGSEFSPAGFIRTSSRGPPPKRNSQQGKPKPGKPPVVHLSLSLREDVKLHETENAWKPGILASSKESNEEDAKTQDLYKKVRGVLNKLTPEKFNKLVGQVQALPIDTHERLTGVINLVFDKAVDEPNFSVAYAKMCNELKTKDVDGASFRKILITRCQQEFEKNKDAENRHMEQKLKEIAAEPDPEKKKELQFTFEEAERKVRMKSVGNIRFIGELFKLGMLTGPIMLRCVEDLLKKEDEESLECLCKLLTTIGKKLEQELLPNDVLASYFTKMKDLSDKKGKGQNISSRVRFMLQDCIDLRAHKWIPRRDDSNPKTMDEIQRESERETLESNLALSQPNTPRKDDRIRGMGDKRGGRGGMPMDDGWKQAPSSRRPIDVNKMAKGLMQGSETATLGSPNQFTKWGGGSGGSAARDTKSLNRTVITGNPYSALTDNKSSVFNNDRKTPSGPPSRDRSMGGERSSGSRSSSQHRTDSQPASRDSSLARGKLDDRRNRVPTPSSLADSSPSDDQPSSDVREDTKGPVCSFKRIEDPDELERVVQNLVQELLNHKNIEEATLAVTDYFDWTNLVPFTHQALAFMLDRMQGHQLVSQFLGHLINTNYMQKHHFLTAFAEILELCPDLIMDIPNLWTYMGALIGHILLTEAVTFKDLAEPLNVLKGSKEAEILLKHIIEVLVKEKGPSWIRDHWNQHGVTWSDFLAAKDVDNFIKDNKFESFTGGAQASRSEMARAEMEDKLLELIKSGVSFDHVQAWIESNVGERTKEPTFIRALMTAICKNAIYESHPNKWQLDTKKLSQDKLLLRYVENKADLELQCLYAVQALVASLDFPQGLIVSIFTTLWEDTLLSTEAFLAWFESEDTQEAEGRGVCKTSLASFRTLLAEVEVDEEEEHP